MIQPVCVTSSTRQLFLHQVGLPGSLDYAIHRSMPGGTMIPLLHARQGNWRRFVLVLATSLLVLAAFASPRTVSATVTPCSERTLDSAIQIANASGGAIELPSGCLLLVSGTLNSGGPYD